MFNIADQEVLQALIAKSVEPLQQQINTLQQQNNTFQQEINTLNQEIKELKTDVGEMKEFGREMVRYVEDDLNPYIKSVHQSFKAERRITTEGEATDQVRKEVAKTVVRNHHRILKLNPNEQPNLRDIQNLPTFIQNEHGPSASSFPLSNVRKVSKCLQTIKDGRNNQNHAVDGDLLKSVVSNVVNRAQKCAFNDLNGNEAKNWMNATKKTTINVMSKKRKLPHSKSPTEVLKKVPRIPLSLYSSRNKENSKNAWNQREPASEAIKRSQAGKLSLSLSPAVKRS